jgi:carboxyl-terminal processing protease
MNKVRATVRGTSIVLSAVCLCFLVFFVPHLHSLPVFALPDGRHGHDLTNTREGRLAVFDDVWETIYERYYDPAFNGADWNGWRGVFRRAAADAQSSQDLYKVLRQMIASLNDLHTRVYSPDEKFDWWNPHFVSVGLAIREIEGVPTIIQVEPKSAPSRVGIQPGDQIESVDGVPVSQMLQQRLGALGASHHGNAARFRAVATLLEGEAGSFTRLGWRTKDGRIKFGSFKRYRSQRKPGFQISRSEGKYLVVEIQSFTQALVFEIARALRNELRGAHGVVLDLRSNGGGDADAMSRIAALFLEEGVELGRFIDRVGVTIPLTTSSKGIFSAVPVNKARLPLIVLVGGRTSSAAEILASMLQTHGRARLVGTGTCGCVLAIRSRHTLPDEGVLDVSEFDYRTADGVRLEGRGVQPEYSITLQRRDLYSKRDRAFEVALNMLKALVKRSER